MDSDFDLSLVEMLCRFDGVGIVFAVLSKAPRLGLPGKLLRCSMGVPALDWVRGLLMDDGASPFFLNLSLEVDGAERFIAAVGAVSKRIVRCSAFRASSNSFLSLSRLAAEEVCCPSDRTAYFVETLPINFNDVDPDEIE
jgi:hypothetical protein